MQALEVAWLRWLFVAIVAGLALTLALFLGFYSAARRRPSGDPEGPPPFGPEGPQGPEGQDGLKGRAGVPGAAGSLERLPRPPGGSRRPQKNPCRRPGKAGFACSEVVEARGGRQDAGDGTRGE